MVTDAGSDKVVRIHRGSQFLRMGLYSCRPVNVFMLTPVHPCHKEKMGQEWFEELKGEFEVLTCSPNSPDLNPIEHLFNVLDKRVLHMVAHLTAYKT